MIKNKNLITKRILSFVLMLTMALPFFAMVFPIIALAEDAGAEAVAESDPTVSISWDTNTVTVIDGVATPYKNASATANSYTMQYKVTATGNITTPITVRVQSFSLSAAAGQEYATVDNTVTLTQQNPSVTGSVTVYTHTGYATKVVETGRVYTNEFGLRITEISNAKKQSGADTIRSQVLVANGYTLNVVKNQGGANYGGGLGATFGNGYVYEGLERDYAYALGTFSATPDKGENWRPIYEFEFFPMEGLNKSATTTLKNLLTLYGDDMTVYFSGFTLVSDKTDDNTYGYAFKIVAKDSNTTVVQNITDSDLKWNWNNHRFRWASYGSSSRIISGYKRNTDVKNEFVRVTSESDEFLLYGKNLAWNVFGGEAKTKYFNNTAVIMAANNAGVTAESFHIENRSYGAGDTIYLTVRFNKPIQIEADPQHPLQIETKIGKSYNSSCFTYCGGNMTNTLIFSMTLPTNVDVNGNVIELGGFDNEDYNSNIGDLFWNTSNRNNMWVYDDSNDSTEDRLDDRLVSGQMFACSIDTRTPTIRLSEIKSGRTGIVQYGEFSVEVSKITNSGKIYVAWTKSQEPPIAQDAWSSVPFFADANGNTTVSFKKSGLTGIYYAHVKAVGISGNQTVFRVESPFKFDNQSPEIKNMHLTKGDNSQTYMNVHTVLFDIADAPDDVDNAVGIDVIYMKARHADGSPGLAGGVNERIIYNSSSDKNDLIFTKENTAQITIDALAMLDLGPNAYDAYTIEFYAIDKLGNQTDVYQFPDALMFDTRSTFAASLYVPEDDTITFNDKQIYYNGTTLTFSHNQNGSTWTIDSLKYNGVNVNVGNLSDYGMSGVADDGNNKYFLTLDETVAGYIEIVFKLNGEKVSNIFNFYVTGKEVDSPNHQKLYATDRLLINKVWQLTTATFYSGNNRNGSPYAGKNIKPIFSSRATALEYAVFFEKQDVQLEYIDSDTKRNDLESGRKNVYRKAAADENIAAEIGQTWIRYKSDTWTPGSNNEEHWVYYFYSNEKETVIDPDLTPSLNAAIDRNAKLICNYNGNGYVYLTANNKQNGYVDSYSEPNYDSAGILTEDLTYTGIYDSEISLRADTDIYDSFIMYEGQEIPLVANYTFNIDAAEHGFVYCRPVGSDMWTAFANGESLKSKLSASGVYEICEFGSGYMTYLVYVDLDAPVISYELTVDGESKPGYIESGTSGGTIRASYFFVKELLDSVSGNRPVEHDSWAYFYIIRNTLGGSEHAFMTMDDLNSNGYEISTGIYKIYACDRLGNTVVQTVKVNTEEIEVKGSVSAAGLTVTSNRAPEDVVDGTFKVWRDNALLSDVSYAQSLFFSRSGTYVIEFEDVYGNIVSESFNFQRGLPSVIFAREKDAGLGSYEQITVNSEDPGNLSNVITEDQQLFIISTSANIRISYPASSGYKFEFIGNEPIYKSSDIPRTNIDIESSSSAWTMKVYHENDPDVYILITCVVDKEAPQISGAVQVPGYQYNDASGAKDNVLFTPSGNVLSNPFYNGERSIGDRAVISWTDETKVANVTYTLNGGEKVAVNTSVDSVTLTDPGAYVLEAVDIFGNASTFEFTLVKHIDFSVSFGGEEQGIDFDSKKYIDGNKYTQTLYTGKEAKITLRENALLAFYYTDNSESALYNFQYEINNGKATLLISTYDESLGEFVIIENGNVVLYEAGILFDGNVSMRYAHRNGELTLIIPECEKAYELWQLRISDATGHNPVIVQFERSDKVPEFNVSREDGTILDLTYNGFIGSNQKLKLDTSSVSDDTVEIIAYYSEIYTKDFENAEITVLYGPEATPILEKEGYYKIVAVNKYGNEKELLFSVRFKLSLDVHIEYDSLDGRIQALTVPNEYLICTNRSAKVVIWDERAKITCLKDGKAFGNRIFKGNGYLEIAFTEVGEYVVTIKDDSENQYLLTISIKAPQTLLYDGFLTGFNEAALKKDQNYTNGALSLDKSRIESSGIKYVAFRAAGTDQFTVLYDLINVSPIEYSKEAFEGSIGKEDGEYEVLFADVYGNSHVETVKISRRPMLIIERQTLDTAVALPYDFDFALQSGAWSNYILTFINTSERYSLKVNGEQASFIDGSYTITLTTDLGAAEQTHVLEYLDDYGNSYKINVYLYRYVPESSVSEGADTVNYGGKLYVKSNFSMVWGEGISATYSLNDGTANPFDADTVFDADGKYTFTFTDYAGNTSTRIIIRDTTVLYDMSSGGFVLDNGAVISSSVSLSPNEDLTFAVTRNGEEYNLKERAFTEDGHYVVSLTDSIGNVSYFEFTIYVKAKQSFTFAVPNGYYFLQIWYITDGHKVSLVSDVTLDENGIQTYTFAIDGAYEIELLNAESNQVCYFDLNIDNVAPDAMIVGATNGEITRNKVSIEGLRSGDTIYVYKDGKLSITYFVDGDSETTLDLLENGDFGEYVVVIEDEAGNSSKYEFTKEFATNTYSNIFICLLLIAFGATGIIYIRFNGKVRTK